jgi:hypothetical protein
MSITFILDGLLLGQKASPVDSNVGSHPQQTSIEGILWTSKELVDYLI